MIDAIVHAARKGTSFGASTPTEADLAELVIEAFPSVEKVRFVSSGTEATMSAIRLARGYTEPQVHRQVRGLLPRPQRRLLVEAGSASLRWESPIRRAFRRIVQFTLALPYNNLPALEEAFAKYKDQIACVIVEPVVGNMGCVPPQSGLPRGTAGHHRARRRRVDPR